MGNKPLRVGSVGLGRWAKVIGTAASRSKKLDIVSCFSRSKEKRVSFKKQFGCKITDSYEELLADENIDGVLLTTPNIVHAETIIQAAKANKHIWIEKPISHKMKEAYLIKKVLDESGITFSVGHSARMLGASRQMKKMIDNQEVGEVSLIEAHWSNERALEITEDSWRWYRDRTPGGPLIQLLVHHFDTLQYLLGPIAEVQAYIQSRITNAEVDDVATVIARFESGNLGYFGSSWVSPGAYWINVYGSKQNLYHELQFDHWTDPDIDKYTSLFKQPHGTLEKIPIEIPITDMFKNELEDWVDAIYNKSIPEVGWKEATMNLACVEASIKSSEKKRPVKITEVMN